MSFWLTILGCGSSGGVPRIGTMWGACDPSNPKNRRRRCGALIERQGPRGRTRVLIDTPPDLRDQLLEAQVAAVDVEDVAPDDVSTPHQQRHCRQQIEQRQHAAASREESLA